MWGLVKFTLHHRELSSTLGIIIHHIITSVLSVQFLSSQATHSSKLLLFIHPAPKQAYSKKKLYWEVGMELRITNGIYYPISISRLWGMLGMEGH